MRAPTLCCSIALTIAACSSPLELSVDVRSDYAPGVEVVAAQVTLTRSGGGLIANETTTLGRANDLLGGVRLLDAAELGPGDYLVEVSLRDASREVAGRRRAVRLDDDLAVTVLLARTCEGVTCGEGTACIAGRCAPESCGPGDVTSCPEPRCAVADECAPRPGCFRRECVMRQCLYVPDDAACTPVDGGIDAGPVDAGGDAGADAGCAAAEICDNGIDDDCDRDADCADADCDAQACEDDGNACTDDVCAAGACGHPARPDGTAITPPYGRCCGGALVDLASDRTNCGACGLACAAGFNCQNAPAFMGPTCDCDVANVDCHGGTGWVCSNVYFVCACRMPGIGACPGDAVCVDDPMGPNFCQYP